MRKVLAFLCCLSALSLAQVTSSTSATVPSSSTVITQAQNAFSGGKAISSVQMNGHASWHYGSDQQTGTATLVANANGASSVTLNLSGGTRKETFAAWDDNPTCDWTGADGKTHANPAHNCLAHSTWFLPSITMQSAQPSTATAPELLQNASAVDTAPHLRQQRAISNGTSSAKQWFQKWSSTDIALDGQTFLPSSLKFSIHPDNDSSLDVPVEIRYSDYRLTSGVQIPFKIHKFINNNLVLEIDLDSATVN